MLITTPPPPPPKHRVRPNITSAVGKRGRVRKRIETLQGCTGFTKLACSDWVLRFDRAGGAAAVGGGITGAVSDADAAAAAADAVLPPFPTAARRVRPFDVSAAFAFRFFRRIFNLCPVVDGLPLPFPLPEVVGGCTTTGIHMAHPTAPGKRYRPVAAQTATASLSVFFSSPVDLSGKEVLPKRLWQVQ